MGNPSVRFDEGRERVGHWPRAFHPNRSCLLYATKREFWTRMVQCTLPGSAAPWVFHAEFNEELNALSYLRWLPFKVV
jgi:hypothetical protein